MFGYSCILGLVVVVWQYIAIRLTGGGSWNLVRPTDVIDAVTGWSKWVFGLVGAGFAYVSSFYVHLKLAELIRAFLELLTSIWNLITSVFELTVGYREVAFTYNNPYLIWFGSITLIGLAIYIIIRYFQLDGAWASRNCLLLAFLAYELIAICMMGHNYCVSPDDIIRWAGAFCYAILGCIVYRYRQYFFA